MNDYITTFNQRLMGEKEDARKNDLSTLAISSVVLFFSASLLSLSENFALLELTKWAKSRPFW